MGSGSGEKRRLDAEGDGEGDGRRGDERKGEEGAIGRDNGAISGMIDAVACGQDVSRSSDAPAALAAVAGNVPGCCCARL